MKHTQSRACSEKLSPTVQLLSMDKRPTLCRYKSAKVAAMMNARLNQQSFWPYHETWLIKTITRHNSPIYDECQSQSAKGFGHTTRRWDEGLTRSPFWGEHPTEHPGPGSGPHPGPGSGPHPGPGSGPGATRATSNRPDTGRDLIIAQSVAHKMTGTPQHPPHRIRQK